MNSGTITDQLLDAVELIVDKAVSQAGYDKTVQAVISKCVTASTGKYSVKYQGGSFYAYAQDPGMIYNPNTQVYVLIPENDMSKRKTILGTVDRLGTNFITDEEKYYYSPNGNNLCINNDVEHGLCSYKGSDSIVLYNNGVKYENFEIDIQGAELYLKNSNFIAIGAMFKTNLPIQHQAKGNYGIKFTLAFEDSLSGKEINREYVVDINKMSGNPYGFVIPTKQSTTFEIDSENFKEIKKIELFSQDFEPVESGQLDNIFISNIELQGVNLMKVDDSTGYSVAIHAKQGLYFETTKLGEDENKVTKELEAIIYKDRTVVPKTDDITYYWFKENSAIYYNSEKYLKLGGQGWEYLNSDLEKGQSTYTVVKANVKSRETKFKCVVVYGGNMAITSNEVTIYNLASNYEVKLESSAGTATKENETTLKCTVIGATSGQQINYSWSKKVDSNLNYEQLEWTAASNVADLTEAIQIVSYKCTATESINGEILGTAIINIVRRDEAEDDDTTFAKVELINGVQVFKYDENGISPELHNYSNISNILPISFKFYNSDGVEVTPAEIGASNIIWRVPTEESMIKTSEVVGTYGEQLSFTIRDSFDRKKTNNTIELEVHYDNKIVKTNTNLIFMKEGDIGSNGTKYTCFLSANPVSGNIPERVVYTKAGERGSLNYQHNSKPFKVMLFENGDLIYDDISANNIAENVIVKYSIDKTIYDDNHTDATNFAINENGTNFMYITTSGENYLKDNPSNILKCEITYNENIYYATLPISLITMNNEGTVYIKEETGFNTVVYDNSGRNPKYDSNNPFELLVYDSMGNEISQRDYVSYDWSVKGGYYLSEWHSVQNLEIKNWGLQKNQMNFRAVDSLLGYNVNNAVCCKVLVNGSLLAEVRIPIEMYLNRYWSIAGNTWNGNTISLDESNGVILAPQVGAGKKEEDNTFTGVFLGSVAKEGNQNIQSGLYAYKHGVQTVALSAEDGSLTLGAAKKGQIYISPTEGAGDHSIIKSGDYVAPEINADGNIIKQGKGLEIDLTDPHIIFGSGKFRVDKDGNVAAAGFATTRDLNDAKTEIEKDTVKKISDQVKKIEVNAENLYFLRVFEKTEDTEFQSGKIYYVQDIALGTFKPYEAPTGDEGREAEEEPKTPAELGLFETTMDAPSKPTIYVATRTTDAGIWTRGTPTYIEYSIYYTCVQSRIAIEGETYAKYDWTDPQEDYLLNKTNGDITNIYNIPVQAEILYTLTNDINDKPALPEVGERPPYWKNSIYFEKVSEGTYLPLTSKPIDWDTQYRTYYEIDKDGKFVNVTPVVDIWSNSIELSEGNDKYIWQTVKNQMLSGGNAQYSEPVRLTAEKILKTYQEFYDSDSDIQPPAGDSNWTSIKPQWTGAQKAYWVRTAFEYTGGTHFYTGYYRDDSWASLTKLNSDVSASRSLLDGLMDGSGNVTVRKDVILITGTDANDKIIGRWIYNHNGIGYQKAKADGTFDDDIESIPTVWTSDGKFDAKSLTVVNLKADSITDGTLHLGKNEEDGSPNNGDLRIYNAQDYLVLKASGEKGLQVFNPAPSEVEDDESKVHTVISPTSGIKGTSTSGDMVYEHQNDEFHVTKEVIEESISFGSVKMLKMTGTHNGIAFVPGD